MKKRYEFTQVDLVENFIKEKGSITTWEAFEIFGITRLSAKIYELRKKYNISSIDTDFNLSNYYINFKAYDKKNIGN